MTAKPTAQDVYDQIVALKPKVYGLAGSITGFKGTETLEHAMGIHNNAVLLKKDVEALTPKVKNVQRPVSVDDGNKLLKLLRENITKLTEVYNQAQAKKSLLDSLPISHLSALVYQDIKEMHVAVLAVGDAMIEVAPAELLGAAKAMRKEVDDMFKNAAIVFSK